MIKCLANIEIPDGCLTCRWDKNNYFNIHTHDFWEFNIVAKGNYKQYINDIPFSCNICDALLVRPNETHKVLPSKNDDYALNIPISQQFMKKVCDCFDNQLYDKLLSYPQRTILLSNDEFENIKKFILELDVYSTMPEKSINLKKMLLNYIINIVYINVFLENESMPSPIKNFIKKISLPENINLSVAEASKISNYSYSHLEKLFRENMGISINKFITSRKLEYACQLLSKSNISVVELSNTLGYGSLSHFTHLFTKTYGISPAKYRKEHSLNKQ